MPSVTHSDSSWPKRVLKVIVLIMGSIIIAAAIWATAAASIENIRFAHGTDQILQLITAAHNLAARDKNFAMQQSEDILDDLIRAGLMTGNSDNKPVTLINPWKGNVQAFSPASSLIRIESNLPGHECRRMAMFFIKNGKDLGLTIAEARNQNGPNWRRFYDTANGSNNSGNQIIEDACEEAPSVTLAFIFSVR